MGARWNWVERCCKNNGISLEYLLIKWNARSFLNSSTACSNASRGWSHINPRLPALKVIIFRRKVNSREEFSKAMYYAFHYDTSTSLYLLKQWSRRFICGGSCVLSIKFITRFCDSLFFFLLTPDYPINITKIFHFPTFISFSSAYHFF